MVGARGPLGELRAVAFQAQSTLAGFKQVGIVLGAVDVVAAEASDAVGVHRL